MPIIADNAEYQIVRTETANGWTEQTIPKPGSRMQNENDLRDQLALARAALTTAWTQMDTIANGTGSQTAAQLSTQMRQVASAVRFALRLEGRLLRIALNDFTGSD